jgi:hypothetical protein
VPTEDFAPKILLRNTVFNPDTRLFLRGLRTFCVGHLCVITAILAASAARPRVNKVIGCQASNDVASTAVAADYTCDVQCVACSIVLL